MCGVKTEVYFCASDLLRCWVCGPCLDESGLTEFYNCHKCDAVILSSPVRWPEDTETHLQKKYCFICSVGLPADDVTDSGFIKRFYKTIPKTKPVKRKFNQKKVKKIIDLLDKDVHKATEEAVDLIDKDLEGGEKK